MNTLTTSKTLSLPITPSKTVSRSLIASAPNQPTRKPMTIRMAYPAPLNKGGPLDLSGVDRVSESTATECPKLLKADELAVVGGEDDPPKLEGVRAFEPIATVDEDDKSKLQISPSPKALQSGKSDPIPDEVSVHLKTLADFFKIHVPPSNNPSVIPESAASLRALIEKKERKEDETGSDPFSSSDSLEALHQLGWQLISLGRGGSNGPPIPPHTSVQSTSNPLWMANTNSIKNRSQQQPIQYPPAQAMSGISMRGNQKYSAFYQHSRKHGLEESEMLRQSTASQFHCMGFPSQQPNRRCSNGPSLQNHGRQHFPPPTVPTETALKPSLNRLQGGGEMTSSPRPRETAFLCSCGQDFDSLYVFTLHMRDTGHKPRSSQPERDIPKLVRGQDMWINSETEQTREILRCMRCNQSFRSLPELTMHMMKTSHYSEIVYSDAGRNLLASQTFSSVGDRNRGGNWASLKCTNTSLKRSLRGATLPQNGVHLPTVEAPKSHKVTIGKALNGCPTVDSDPATSQTLKSPKLAEGSTSVPRKRERPASSHELHLENRSPKRSTSPDAMSCPSDLQRSAVSSPHNEPDKDDQKYIDSPTSSRGIASPSQVPNEEDAGRKNCSSDSAIRQMESFVEKSLPFPTITSPIRSGWQQRQPQIGPTKVAIPRQSMSPLTETETSRSTPEKLSNRKRRFSSGSSNSIVPLNANTASPEAPSEKRPVLPFSATPTLDGLCDYNSENPLFSLQKLVETTHHTAVGPGGTPLKSPLRPFSQTSEISPTPSNHSNEMEQSLAPTKVSSVPTASPASQATVQQPNIVAALSALQNFMSRVSSNSQQQQQQPLLHHHPHHIHHRPSEAPRPQEGTIPAPNGEEEKANWMGILGAVLNAAKQFDVMTKHPEANVSLAPSAKLQPTAVGMFGQPVSVFSSGGFDFGASNKPGLMTTAPMNSSGANMVANITKKAKCHFCGKPFANKGQVRLHISKNKCPCLLQQSAAAAMSKTSVTANPGCVTSASVSEKRPMTFSYPGFPPAAAQGVTQAVPLGATDLSRLFGEQQQQQQQQQQLQRPCDSKPTETAALAALLRHFNLSQQGRLGSANQQQPSGLKPTDLLATLARASCSGGDPNIADPFLSLIFPSTSLAPSVSQPPPPPPQPSMDTTSGTGLSPEQKTLFLFAQAMVSLAMSTPNSKLPEEVSQLGHSSPTAAYPLVNFLQAFNTATPPPASSTTTSSQPVSEVDWTLTNPEMLASYMTVIRQLSSLGNTPQMQTSVNNAITSSSASTEGEFSAPR